VGLDTKETVKKQRLKPFSKVVAKDAGEWGWSSRSLTDGVEKNGNSNPPKKLICSGRLPVTRAE